MQLTGLHHLTAITADAKRNHAFYTRTLGMRLVKKTVNQDDVSAYHLFYADALASPGTDLTFFDWSVPREQRGTRSIVRTGLRVAGEASLNWWLRHFDEAGVFHGGLILRDGRPTIDFEDPEGQRLSLIDDNGRGESHPWEASPIPAPHQIRGLGPVTISVPDFSPTDLTLTNVLNMRRARMYSLFDDGEPKVHAYEMGPGGPSAELHLVVEPGLTPARSGAGGVHHVALRTPDLAQYQEWAAHLRTARVPSSGPVDRYYFKSLYFREPGGILFEIATDGPGFTVDEPLESLGNHLSLPPFLADRRQEIEENLDPLVLAEA
jgi:glyoxalase family protein